MAKKYLIHHHPERSLPDEFTDDFCRIWLFKLETYRYINVRPLAYCCGLDRIIQTTPTPFGALRLWMMHHSSKVDRIWRHDIIVDRKAL